MSAGNDANYYSKPTTADEAKTKSGKVAKMICFVCQERDRQKLLAQGYPRQYADGCVTCAADEGFYSDCAHA